MIRGSVLTLRDRARDVGRRVVASMLTVATRRIVSNGQRLWPVDTGRSRRLLSATAATAAPKPKATLRDGSGYAPDIVSGGIRPWRAYIAQPAADFVQRTGPRQIATAILRELRVTRG